MRYLASPERPVPTIAKSPSALLVGNRILQEEEGIFVLACLSDHTMKLIKISQLDSVLTILPTVEEGVDAVFMHEIEKDMKKD